MRITIDLPDAPHPKVDRRMSTQVGPCYFCDHHTIPVAPHVVPHWVTVVERDGGSMRVRICDGCLDFIIECVKAWWGAPGVARNLP